MEPETTAAQQPDDAELISALQKLLVELGARMQIAQQLDAYNEIAQRFPAAPHRVAPTATPLQPFEANTEERQISESLIYGLRAEMEASGMLDDDEDNEGEQYLADAWFEFEIIP